MTRRKHNNRSSAQDRKSGGDGKNLHHPQHGKVVKEKFQEERKRSIPNLIAKTNNQKLALRAFTERQLIVLSGIAGAGKTELMCWWASKLWLEGKIDNIVITRPNRTLGKDGGAVPGSDSLKLLSFCLSMLTKFRKYLGVGILKNNFKMEVLDSLFSEVRGIVIMPLEKIQGMSFDDRTILICDEMQNADVAQMKAVVTRCEEGCQVIISGDPRQTAIGKRNGLVFIQKALVEHPTRSAEVVEFNSEDCLRHGISAHLAKVFEEMGENWVDGY
jgi:phosphate starvation-inducible PhoH-like protein